MSCKESGYDALKSEFLNHKVFAEGSSQNYGPASLLEMRKTLLYYLQISTKKIN